MPQTSSRLLPRIPWLRVPPVHCFYFESPSTQTFSFITLWFSLTKACSQLRFRVGRNEQAETKIPRCFPQPSSRFLLILPQIMKFRSSQVPVLASGIFLKAGLFSFYGGLMYPAGWSNHHSRQRLQFLHNIVRLTFGCSKEEKHWQSGVDIRL